MRIMKERQLFEKRKYRSEVFIDIDDFNILGFLSFSTDKESFGKEIAGLQLNALKKKMNMSHKGLLVHLKRLSELNLITIFRAKGEYKFKTIAITKNGRVIFKELMEAIELKKQGKFKIIADKTTFWGVKKEELTIG